jgi:hypothetical protein
MTIKGIRTQSSKKLAIMVKLMKRVMELMTYHFTTASMYFSSLPRKLTNASEVTLLRKIKSSQVSGPAGGKQKSN